MKGLLAITLLFIGAFSMTPINSNDRHVLYSRSGLPAKSGWRVLKEADELLTVTFTIALKQQNLDKLESMFWDNANPYSPNYAKHFTRQQIREIVSASESDQRQVLSWLYTAAAEVGEHHLINIENRGDALVVKAHVKLVERLFSTKMFLLHNERKGWVMAKHMGPLSIPMHLSSHIDMITGITELPPARIPFMYDRDEKIAERKAKVAEKKEQKKQNADNACNVPYTIKNQYNVPLNLAITNPNANVSIYAEISAGTEEGFGIGSVKDFEVANGLKPNPITCILGNGDVSYYQNDTDIEAQLDTQMITGMTNGAKVCFWIMDGGNGWMYEYANLMFQTENAPIVVSMSYGWVEFEQCINETDGTWFLGNCTNLHIPDSKTYVNRTNVEFMKLGLLGHTLLAASGDDGTCGTHGSPNGCTALGPIFPAASPYVLTVGATSIEPSTGAHDRSLATPPPICTQSQYDCTCSTSTNEQVASGNNTAEFDSGGGFSVFSPAPSFQTKAVQAYLNSGVALPSKQFQWSGNNRGFPDIAAIGENFCCLDPGQPCSLIGGTSASCPLIASLITFLNQDRLNAGKTPLGYVNHIIYDMFYANPTQYFYNGFDDANNGGECGNGFGFNAKPGYWTPLTGVGSPKFDQIRQYVSQLP